MKHFEFWPLRLFELPYYLYLAAGALARRLPPRFLAKANYALDHGEIGIGTKTRTQFAFDQTRFYPPLRCQRGYRRMKSRGSLNSSASNTIFH